MNLKQRLEAVYLAAHKVTGAHALAPGLEQFAWRHRAVQEFNNAYAGFVHCALTEKLDQIIARAPSREVCVEHYILVCKKFYDLHNGVFGDMYSVLVGGAVPETFKNGLEREMTVLIRHANGAQLSALQVGAILMSRPNDFFTAYPDLVQHLDPAVRYELLEEFWKALG